VGGDVRQTLVLVIVGCAGASALVAGLVLSSPMLDGLGALGLVACVIGLLNRGLRAFLEWFVSQST
jgi:hypothetical protein